MTIRKMFIALLIQFMLIVAMLDLELSANFVWKEKPNCLWASLFSEPFTTLRLINESMNFSQSKMHFYLIFSAFWEVKTI